MALVAQRAEVVRALAGRDAFDAGAGMPVDHLNVIGARHTNQQVFLIRRDPHAGRRGADGHAPHHGLRGQIDGHHLVGVLHRNEGNLAVCRKGDMAGRLGCRNLLGDGERVAIPTVDVNTVQTVAGGQEPLLVGRKADLVRVINARHALLNLARDRIKEHQIVADRVGDNQRLFVRRGNQVVGFLADREGLQHLAGVLVDQ